MRRGPIALALGIALALFCAPGALAAITVSTTRDETIAGDGTCSLREAVQTASGMPSPDCPGVAVTGTTVIDLPVGHYHLSQGAQLALSGTIALVGTKSDPSQTIIDADHHSRAIFGQGTIGISNLTITGGQAPHGTSGASGAAGQAGQDGGGIYNDAATMNLTNVVLTGNASGNGGHGGDRTSGCTPAGRGGDGGNGGAIFNAGPLTLNRVTLTGNRTGDGGTGGKGRDVTGSSAGCPGGDGGRGGQGGAIFSFDHPATIVGSAITENVTGNGGPGGSGGNGQPGGAAGVGGDGGDGSGVADSSFSAVTISGSTIADNVAGSGGVGGTGGWHNASGGNGATGGQGGSGGAGAGVLGDNAFSTLRMTNVTLAGNTAGDGGYGGTGGIGSGSGHAGGTGGLGGVGGEGGGLFQNSSSAVLSALTVSSNLSGDGGGPGLGGGGEGGAGPGALGTGGASGIHGGIGLGTTPPPNAANVSEQDTIVASNLPANCDPAVTSSGHNLSFPDTTCPHEFTGDAKLGPLQDHGGVGQTEALQPGSAAINRVPAKGAGCPSTDERLVPRPQPNGGLCDVGAYEVAPVVCRSLSVTTGAKRSIRIALSCGDPARLAPKYVLLRRPAHGTLTSFDSARGQVTYTPRSGFTGHDSFTYRATNANGTAPAHTVAITVKPVPPVLSNVKLVNHRFKATVGSPLRFTLSARATLTVTVTHKSGRLAGTLTFRREPAGNDTVRLFGQIAGHTLAPGAYKAKLVAGNQGGNSVSSAVTFTIVR